VVRDLGVREVFVPRPGCAYLDADIAGLESVTLAQVEIWTLKDHRKANQINAGVDLLSVTGAAIAGTSYDEFMPRARGVGMPKDPVMAHIRNLTKVPVYGKPGGMADETLVGFARTSYGIKLGATKENPRPSLEAAKAEARRIGGFWRQANPNDQDYLDFIRTTRGQDGMYHVIIGHPSIGNVIRRGKATYCSACNSLFQGLGALAAAEVTFELQRRCYNDPKSALYGARLVVFAYDQWLLEIELARVTDGAVELQHVIETFARRKIPDVIVRAEPCASTTWSKSAERVVDGAGNLLVWGSPQCTEYLELKKEVTTQ
jgi:hypothetical protein